ncbi:hypothetical protein EI94DRAFT_1700571 [Lactarius quietus]|nr:hypothetical protein EI94DRAFT_1700571 [Lactarius quietus]
MVAELFERGNLNLGERRRPAGRGERGAVVRVGLGVGVDVFGREESGSLSARVADVLPLKPVVESNSERAVDDIEMTLLGEERNVDLLIIYIDGSKTRFKSVRMTHSCGRMGLEKNSQLVIAVPDTSCEKLVGFSRRLNAEIWWIRSSRASKKRTLESSTFADSLAALCASCVKVTTWEHSASSWPRQSLSACFVWAWIEV